MITTLLTVFIVLCVLAVLWWGLQQLPFPPVFKTALTVVVAVLALLWLLNFVQGGSLHITR